MGFVTGFGLGLHFLYFLTREIFAFSTLVGFLDDVISVEVLMVWDL
jgi:hypothetical protein